MKVKTVLNASAYTHFEMFEPNLYSYDVDILRKPENCFSYGGGTVNPDGGGIVTNRLSAIPDRVLNYEVEMISVNTASLALTIYSKL